jgi:hypothetical protein
VSAILSEKAMTLVCIPTMPTGGVMLVARRSAWTYTSPAQRTAFVHCSPQGASRWQRNIAAMIGKLSDNHCAHASAVARKRSLFSVAFSWDIRFGGTCRLHLQGRKSAEQEIRMLHVDRLLARLIFDPENGGYMFLRNARSYMD